MDLRNERLSYLQSKLLKFDSNPRVGKQQWQLIMLRVLLHNCAREGGG